jgi:hypothetical protein
MKRKVMDQRTPDTYHLRLSPARCGLFRCQARCNLQRPKRTADAKDSATDEDPPPCLPMTQGGVEVSGFHARCDRRNELSCGTLKSYLC